LGGFKSSTDLLALPQFKDSPGKSEVIAEVEQRTPDLPVRIIAGNHRQAEAWAAREGLKPDRWRYVPDGSARELEGIRNVRFVWIGTFWNRRDFDEVCKFVDNAVAMGIAVVDRNEVVNKGRKTRTQTEPETGTQAGPLS
jgi:hypothetical protein